MFQLVFDQKKHPQKHPTYHIEHLVNLTQLNNIVLDHSIIEFGLVRSSNQSNSQNICGSNEIF